jgi:hypothetical protein
MTSVEQLVKVTAAMPEMRQLLLSQKMGGLGITAVELDDMLGANTDAAIITVATAYEWDFSTRRSDNVDTVVGTAEYTMKGESNNCLQVISVAYGDDETFLTFQSKDQIRDKLTYSTITAMTYWVPVRRDGDYQVIKIYGAPEAAHTLTYDYFRNKVEIGEIPSSIDRLLQLSLARCLMPRAMESAYNVALAEAIGSLERETGNPRQAVMDTEMRNGNLRRAANHGRM